MEESITCYLHAQGIKMKTDPTNKEQNFYIQVRKKINKNNFDQKKTVSRFFHDRPWQSLSNQETSV